MTPDVVKVYMVNVQGITLPGNTGGDSPVPAIERFNLYLQDSVDILAYWNYIALLYMVKTKLTARELAIKFTPFLGSRYIVAQIDPTNVDGQLPKEAWDWIYFPHNDRSLSLGDLLATLPRPG